MATEKQAEQTGAGAVQTSDFDALLRKEFKPQTDRAGEEISSALRSATGGSGSAGFPDRSARTPITKGSWTFFCAPYSSTSYSICTRGARLRPMNF